jgi:beta-phosphoglucomutase
MKKRLARRPKAVIFDMDGVIIDSMPYHFIAWYEALRPFGARVSCLDVYSKEGERWERSLEDFLRRANAKTSKVAMRKIFSARQRIFKKYFKPFVFQGAEEFLRCLKARGYLLALVTGTPMDQVREILPRRIRNLFVCIVTGDRVKRGKPHPEPYLRAARCLGVSPAECVVVENAPFGIESAKRAGMFCVALTTSLPREHLKRADIVIDNLGEIAGVIDSSCRV